MSIRTRLGLAALAPILLLFALLLFFPPDGLERAQWAQFIGRFHPLVIHFPIALILLAAVLEVARKIRYFPDPGRLIDVVLALAGLSAIVASTLGWCLARSGGYSGSLVTQHMWGGLSLTAACCLCWVLRGRLSGERTDLAYSLALLATVSLVLWTGHRGGQLSLGENYLTEFAPAKLRGLLGTPAPDNSKTISSMGGPATLYGSRVQPIFAGHCVTCHGQAKHSGNLRLDSYQAVMHGGKQGRVIRAGEPKQSELFRRVTLPPTDNDFMPAEHRRPLSANEVKAIEIWISAGASGTLSADVFNGLPSVSSPVADITIEEADPAAVSKQRTPLAASVARLQKQFPGALDYESRGSADLVVDISVLGSKFGDEDLAALKPLAGQIVEADFSNTAITDRSATVIAAMKRLRVLRLMHTKISDATVRALNSMDQLESLSLFGTAVTPAALPVVEHLPRLRHIYVGETRITASASMPEALKRKVVF